MKGLELDERTLALIDADGDGRIRLPELLAAVKWACARLKEPAALLQGADTLPLEAIDDQAPLGRPILAAARQVLVRLGRKDAVAVRSSRMRPVGSSPGPGRQSSPGTIGSQSIASASSTR